VHIFVKGEVTDIKPRPSWFSVHSTHTCIVKFISSAEMYGLLSIFASLTVTYSKLERLRKFIFIVVAGHSWRVKMVK